MILPHESWEVQCVSGAEVSHVCSSASLPSPDSAGTRAATYGGSFRWGIHHSLVSTGQTALAHGSRAVCAPHFWRSQNGDPAPVFFCPMCAYVTNNPTTFLDHIVVGHYWGSFSCGVCLAFATLTAAEMKAHLLGCGQYGDECSKAQSPCKKAQGSKSGRKSKGKKSKDRDGMKGNK